MERNNILEHIKNLLYILRDAEENITIPNKESAWFGHCLLSYLLIRAVQPKTLVELGTHNGISLASFLSFIKYLDLDCTCFGIDNWDGDKHTGDFNENVYLATKLFFEQNFKYRSKLIKKNFDEALDDFDDGTIDFLHIDGYHTYDAAKKDFTNWLPKMNKNSVILIHDIHEYKEDFGVHFLWKEIKNEYRTLEFRNNHGLGLAFLGFPDFKRLIFDMDEQEVEVDVLIKIIELYGERFAFKKNYQMCKK